MHELFKNAKTFNEPLDNWDVSNVTNMSGMFASLEYFNQPLDNWDVSNVKNMSGMFAGAKTFNQPLNDWNTSNVITMGYMFSGAKAFNQSLNDWDVSNVLSIENMFSGATAFTYATDFQEQYISNRRDDVKSTLRETLNTSGLTINPSTDEALSFIEGDVNVLDYLKEDIDNIVFIKSLIIT